MKLNTFKRIYLIIFIFILINIIQTAEIKQKNHKNSQISNKNSKLKNNLTLIELSNKFHVNKILENKFRKTNQNFGNLSRRILNSNKVVETYRDNFIRFKIFPLAAAAYGTNNNIIACLTQIYPEFQFIKNWVVKCQGVDDYCSAFIAVSFTDKAIVLSFRGTDSFWQLTHEVWQTIFRRKVPSVFGYGHVAYYFDNIFNQLDKKGVTEEIFYLIRKYTDYELWITGHSLGGALAAIAAAKIIESKSIRSDRIKLVTFGQPRTGDSGFAAAMSQNLPFFNYRVTRARDLVVHVPPRSYEDYAHYRTEIFYNNEMNPGDKWIRCVQGDEDKNCANQYSIYTISDHTKYFGRDVSNYGLSGCYGG